METRANYVLIGAFALAGFLGVFAFFLWFAQVELDRQFAYYDIDFTSVSGLSEASDVRFAGLPIGQVVDVRLSPENDGTVRVRVEVDAETPVRVDSVATIEALGVTGVSFVGISAGTPDSQILTDASDDAVPMIEAGQSVLQVISEDAPEIVSETLEIIQELSELVTDENRQSIQNIITNIEQSSEAFAQALDDFSAVSGAFSGFAGQIERFNNILDTLQVDVSSLLEAAEMTLVSVDGLSMTARSALNDGSDTLEQAQTAIASAERYINEDLGPATRELAATVDEIERQIAALSETYTRTGDVATLRLTEAQETLAATNALIARIDETLVSVDGAARRIDGLVAESATPLIEELRVATAEATSVIQTIGEATDTDLPAIISDIREATTTALGTIETVGADLSSASGQIDDLAASADVTLQTVQTTFANANETLSAINGALETGDRALSAAESAFSGATRVMDEDVAQITESLRTTLAELEAAVGTVASEVPGVTEELRSASQSAEAAFAEIARAVDASSPAVRDFATSALPQYGRLAAETRALIDNLDALIEQIRRDPSRFFLDPRAPEFRR